MHVGGQLLGGELCSPISVEHDPTGEAATGGSGHVERGDDQVGALLLAHGLSEHSARVCLAHGAQVDPAVRAAQVGKVRDPHAVSRALVPLVGAVVLMGHRGRPPRLAGRGRACKLVRPRRRIDAATARTPTSTPPCVRAHWMRGVS